MISKKDIRKEILSKRKALDNHELITKSSLIVDKILNHKVYINSQVVYCYSSINNEVCLDLLMEDIVRQKKVLALPKVEDNNITFYQVSNPSKLKKGYFDIMEPYNCPKAKPADLIIVPGVAFTKNGDRLGYGGGFYDRFLSLSSAYTLGVGFDFQILETLPTQEHDKKLNDIIYA